MTDLAKRAVACKHWRWMPGMLIRTIGGPTDRIAGIDATYIHAWAESQQSENPRGMWIRYRRGRMEKHGVPDLTDPATLGCLLSLVESLHGVAWLEPCPTIGWFCTYGKRGTPDKESTYAMTRAEALVAALEAAP